MLGDNFLIVVYIYLSILAFYTLYLAIMSLYRGYLAKTLSLESKLLGYPILVVGLTVDFVMNVTLFSLIFLELPSEWLVTARLKRHINKSTWRGKLARWLCHTLLSPFDPTGDHCDN
jgi:hypothetical protein